MWLSAKNDIENQEMTHGLIQTLLGNIAVPVNTDIRYRTQRFQLDNMSAKRECYKSVY